MALKRLEDEGPVLYELGHVRLWRDDLSELISIIAEVDSNISMTIPGYHIDHVDDLEQYREDRIESFDLLALDSGLQLQFRGDRAALVVSTPNITLRGVAAEIVRVAETKRRGGRKSLFVSAAAFASCLTVAGLLGYVTHANNDNHWQSGEVLSVVVSLLGVVLFYPAILGVLWSRRSRSSAIMYSRLRREAPPWISRNKDALVTNAIVSVIFLVVGILIGTIWPLS